MSKSVCVYVCVCVCVLSLLSDSATPWTIACQAPLSMEFSRLEHWGGLPFPSPGDLPDPGIKLVSLVDSFIDRWILHNEPLGKRISVTIKGYILDEFKAILKILQCLSFLIAMLRIIATICIMGLLQGFNKILCLC